MELKGLKQPPFNTTLMGVVKGALDYYGIKSSDAWAFGGSGHAFLINIHKALCPSGPYCWNYDWFYPLVRNLGLVMTDLGFFHKGSPADERAGIERTVKTHLDAGRPCSVLNMENQLVAGYDDKGFLLTRPWDCALEVTPERLTYSSWQELGNEVHVNFFAFEKAPPQSESRVICDSLRVAVELFRDSKRHAETDYGIGPDAYDNWAQAAEKHGASHGNWWNAMVWSECRKMAGAYFAEIAAKRSQVAGPCGQLNTAYAEIGALLEKIADKEMKPDEKTRIATELKQKEGAAVAQVEQLLAHLGA
jgi:hypothetical protein